MTDFIIVGGQAFTPEEYAGYRKYQARKTARLRERRQNDPEYRARHNAYFRELRWRRRGAEGFPIRAVASLHSLRCTGPTKGTGCRCHKTILYERVESAA